MAVFRNVMAFLGLDDDDQVYDDEAYYDDEAEETPSRRSSAKHRTIGVERRLESGGRSPTFGFAVDSEAPEVGGVGAVRPLRPVPMPDPEPTPSEAAVERRTTMRGPGAFAGDDALPDATPAGLGSGSQPVASAVPTVAPEPVHHEPSPSRPPQESQPTVVTHAKPRLHVPSSFDEASRIADDFRAGSPVVMNLSGVDKPVARRLIDFASGVCYVLGGGMERLTASVYLLTPHGIDVSPEDRRRMHERGFRR